MTILEMMERANTRDTKLTIAWVKDAIHAVESTQVENLKVTKTDIVKNTREYDLPSDLISFQLIFESKVCAVSEIIVFVPKLVLLNVKTLIPLEIQSL